MSELKRTVLYDVYREHGGKTIDFGGFDLPVQFTSIKEEHEAVRTKAGMFDVSHMGEFFLWGKDSETCLQKICTNDISKLAIGRALYTVMCNEEGGTIDDLLVYKLDDLRFMLIVNAGNIEKDKNWILSHLEGEVEFEDRSEDMALIAVQGPNSAEIVQQIFTDNIKELKYFTFIENANSEHTSAIVSRTGYTGEDGFEIYCDKEDAIYFWKKLIEAGKEYGLVPCGLGARDTLRFESCLPLYGQELDDTISPFEAKVGFVVKLQKEDFIGKKALQKQKEEGLTRKSVGIEMIDRGIPRHGYKVFSGDEEIGFVTTGTQSPLTKRNIGLALLSTEYTEIDTEIFVEIRGKKAKAKVVSTPFYKRDK